MANDCAELLQTGHYPLLVLPVAAAIAPVATPGHATATARVSRR